MKRRIAVLHFVSCLDRPLAGELITGEEPSWAYGQFGRRSRKLHHEISPFTRLTWGSTYRVKTDWGWLWGAFNQSQTVRGVNGSSAGRNIELGEDVAHVFGNRGARDEQCLGDLEISEA